MGIEYTLGKTTSGNYPELSRDEKDAIIKRMGIYGFGDCIVFQKRNRDGSTFGSDWGTHNLACFKELKGHERLRDMPDKDVRKLAVRMYELLYTEQSRSPRHYESPPKINQNAPKFRQILEELIALQATEKRLLESGELVFPQISAKELAFMDSW